MKKIFSSLRRNVIPTLILIFMGSFLVYAAAPTGGYLPGQTLDPDCTPGTTGTNPCIVKANTLPDQTGNTGKVLGTDGVTTSWVPIPSAPVSSVFGRTGVIVAQSGDYNTDQVTEGSTNLYFTPARFSTQFATKTTDNLSEGSTNLYYTNTRHVPLSLLPLPLLTTLLPVTSHG